MPNVSVQNVHAQAANALSQHLRTATRSKMIPRTHRVIPQGPVTRRMRVAGGGAFPGLGTLDKPIPSEHVQHLALPLASAIPRSRSRTLSIPISRKLPVPQYHRTAESGGGSFPGIGGEMLPGLGDSGGMLPGLGNIDNFFLGDINHDQLAGTTTVVRGQKPRTMGSTLPVYHDFIPGLGEESDGDMWAEGYLNADDLAADVVPTTPNPAADAAAAGAAAMKKLVFVTLGVAVLGMFLLKR